MTHGERRVASGVQSGDLVMRMSPRQLPHMCGFLLQHPSPPPLLPSPPIGGLRQLGSSIRSAPLWGPARRPLTSGPPGPRSQDSDVVTHRVRGSG